MMEAFPVPLTAGLWLLPPVREALRLRRAELICPRVLCL